MPEDTRMTQGMASQLETLGGLERRLRLSISPQEIESKVNERLRSLARSVRMPGFRPGKVPLKMVAQSYGPQVQAEILGDAVNAAFKSAVDEHKLRVAGQPRIEAGSAASDEASAPEASSTSTEGAGADGQAAEGASADVGVTDATPGGALTEAGDEAGLPPGFTATFEVYPDVKLKDPAEAPVERFASDVGDAELDRTLDMLRKQRTTYSPIERSAANGDRLTIDFSGKLDGEVFEGGAADDFTFVLGEGRMLPDFEKGLQGANPGQSLAFPVAFPEDYGNKTLAGKTATFDATVKKIEAPALPELDADFARQMGVADGDVEKFKGDVRANLEREVDQRVKARTKASAMEAIAGLADIDLPKALVAQESEQLAERMRADLQARGVDVAKVPVPRDAFTGQAEKRVRLGLIVGEIVREHQLQAKPNQMRKQIEEFAKTYENPGEVIRWYYSDRERLAEVEAMVVEQNVVDWLLTKAKVEDRKLSFDELMAENAQ